jgi:hypothetical protein
MKNTSDAHRAMICRAAAHLLTFSLASTGIGCAARGVLVDEDSPLSPVTDLYGRNAIVSIPTLIGNGIGAMVGLPLFFVFLALEHSDPNAKPASCNWASVAAMMSLVAPGVAVGAITGAPFVPLALLAPEDPGGTCSR